MKFTYGKATSRRGYMLYEDLLSNETMQFSKLLREKKPRDFFKQRYSEYDNSDIFTKYICGASGSLLSTFLGD
jgi:hypothetical protein